MAVKMKEVGSLIVSWDFGMTEDGTRKRIMLVGDKKPRKPVRVINIIQGDEAIDLWHKLTADYELVEEGRSFDVGD